MELDMTKDLAKKLEASLMEVSDLWCNAAAEACREVQPYEVWDCMNRMMKAEREARKLRRRWID